jgi:hypothetical protein
MNDPDSKKEIANSCDSKSSDAATTRLGLEHRKQFLLIARQTNIKIYFY